MAPGAMVICVELKIILGYRSDERMPPNAVTLSFELSCLSSIVTDQLQLNVSYLSISNCKIMSDEIEQMVRVPTDPLGRVLIFTSVARLLLMEKFEQMANY
uniref:At2g29910 protein n=1 Tax=Fopius arisanus TaxID=64838 RepID=A0A0C9QND8_9HYME